MRCGCVHTQGRWLAVTAMAWLFASDILAKRKGTGNAPPPFSTVAPGAQGRMVPVVLEVKP